MVDELARADTALQEGTRRRRKLEVELDALRRQMEWQAEKLAALEATIEKLRTVAKVATSGALSDSGPVGNSWSPPKGYPLTTREQLVLQLASEGATNADIANKLGISRRTVEMHRCKAMRKLNLHNQTELVRFAIRQGILQP